MSDSVSSRSFDISESQEGIIKLNFQSLNCRLSFIALGLLYTITIIAHQSSVDTEKLKRKQTRGKSQASKDRRLAKLLIETWSKVNEESFLTGSVSKILPLNKKNIDRNFLTQTKT